MKMKARSVQQIVQDEVHRWQFAHAEPQKIPELLSVITISREPGSGGNILAERLGDELGYDVYHQKILHRLAESTHLSTSFLEHLDEKGLSPFQNYIYSTADRHHFGPDQYLRHLLKIIKSIGNNGRAVIVGRGANFILPPAERFSVRVVAPKQLRIERLSRDFGISMQEAKKRVCRTESDRKAFNQKYFNADVTAPENYDMIINTGRLSIEDAVHCIKYTNENETCVMDLKEENPIISLQGKK
jgi:cytidylate kinase